MTRRMMMTVLMLSLMLGGALLIPARVTKARAATTSPAASTITVNSTADGPVAEVQQINVEGIAGTFTLTFNGQTTNPMSFNATSSDVAVELNTLPSIGGVGGRVYVSFQGIGIHRVTFGGTLGSTNVPQMFAAGTHGASAVVGTLQNGESVCPGRDCTLRGAIGAAAGGDTIQFSSLFDTPQTITLTSGELVVDKDLTIQGPGAKLLTVSGNNASRVFSISHGIPIESPYNVTLSGLMIANGNDPGDLGGGIHTEGRLTLINSTVSGNTAAQGGGILLFGGSMVSLNVISSTISGNMAVADGADGGGIGTNCSGGCTVNVINSTIAGNSATRSVGGIGSVRFGDVTINLTNSTITGNSAQAGGGVHLEGNGVKINAKNTLIALNTATLGADLNNNNGVFTSQGYNLIGSIRTTASGTTITQPTDQLGVNPLVELDAMGQPKLAFNGGPTQTVALLCGSPALDRGSNALAVDAANAPLATDQRGTGFPRVFNTTVDIGAFESQQNCNTPPTITGQTVTLKQGSNPASFAIANVTDPDQSLNLLTVAINGSPTSNGVTISGLSVSPAGQVTANIGTTCAAGNAVFNLTVTDNQNATGSGTLTVNVQPNMPPMLIYGTQTVVAGAMPSFGPAIGPADNGAFGNITLTGITPATGLALSVNPATGVVSVTSATLTGSYTVVISLTDNCTATTNASFTVNVTCPNVTVNPASLPGAQVSTAYPQMLTASPGGASYSFAVTSGLLPAGLTLSGGGSFSGAPTQTGVFNFRVTATGFGSCSGFRDYTLAVTCPTVAVTPASLPGGAIGAPYNQTVAATPASPAGSYGYSVSSGALPLGLMLNAATGAITGTPAATGTFSFTIMADAGSCGGSRSYSVTIGCSAASLPASLPSATAGMTYSQSAAAQPAGAYTYSLTAGSLPSGLMLTPSTGSLSGLPAVTGTYNFTVKAQTASGCSGTQTYSLAVGCPAITLSALLTPNLNSPYSQTVIASPSGGNYSFAVTGGLPAGLSLNPATGTLSGTPTASGAFNFTVTATGFGSCTGSQTFSFVIGGGCPNITLPDLPGGAPGQLYSQTVTASPAGNYSYSLSGALPTGLSFYSAFGMIHGYPTQAGTHSFTITATGANNCAGSKTYNLTIGGAAATSLVFGDFDGDGKADPSVWRGQPGDWLIANSGDGQLKTEAWGSTAAPYFDVMTPGDYDGDGRMDLAVFRRATGQWLIKGSQDGAITARQWGVAADVPVAADYDGDGKTDIAVWRGADTNWYILRSSDGEVETVSWGTSNAPYRDVPVHADYDGDGKTDIAVFRQANGHWYIRLSSDGTVVDKFWGLGSDVPVAADYDGDGKADIAVWRGAQGHWYIVRSADGATQTVSWGTSSLGDVPVPGDYDGDGKADVAVWRASEGHWYARLSRANSVMTKVHGQPGDSPTLAKARP